VCGVGPTGDAAGALVGAVVGSGVLAAGAVGAFLVGDTGTTDVSIELALIALDWLTEVFADSDDMACDVYTFTEEVVGSFWGRADNFE
jgi:hypothetical protein